MLNTPPRIVPTPSARSPAASRGWLIRCPTMSPSARNIPVDSIITTIITSVMVRIITGSKVGIPKWNGRIGANQAAAATFSKCIIPIDAARSPPTTIPISTAMLDRKPRPKRAISRIVASTTPAIRKLRGAA